jgi:hypothetical protein
VESAEQIITRVFERGRQDPVAAPLAGAIGEAYREGRWTAAELDRRVRDTVARLAAPMSASDAEEGS